MDNIDLIEEARAVLNWRQLSEECTSGEVSAALVTTSGHIFTGVSVSAACGIGFCAEYGAVAQMICRRESRIQKLVALSGDGKFMPPCGRCRELLYQVDRENLKAEIILGLDKTITLAELLPERWQDVWQQA